MLGLLVEVVKRGLRQVGFQMPVEWYCVLGWANGEWVPGRCCSTVPNERAPRSVCITRLQFWLTCYSVYLHDVMVNQWTPVRLTTTGFWLCIQNVA